jgi:uncharacterized damage-inducible protein DinB
MSEITTLKQVLIQEAEMSYNVTENLFKKVSNSQLNWKPETGKNWMTVAQLLMHCSKYACGDAVKGFITGVWETPEGGDPEHESNQPPAEKLPKVTSVEEALDLLEKDKNHTLQQLKDIEESVLLSKNVVAPWGGPEAPLFNYLLMMIDHLKQHKGQLFYYLKLMGKDVNTGDLWGM